MPKVVWKQFLLGKYKPPSPVAERSMLFEIRNRARQCMTDLTFIVRNLSRIEGDSSGKQFAQIFTNELLGPFFEAYYEGRAKAYRYMETSLNDPFTVPTLMLALKKAAIKHNPRRLHEKSYRTTMAERLLKEELRAGRPYWKEASKEIMKDVEAHKARAQFFPIQTK